MGGGFQAGVVAEAIDQIPFLRVKGFTDVHKNSGQSMVKLGYTYLGNDGYFEHQSRAMAFHLGLGSEMIPLRLRLAMKLIRNHFEPCTVIHPSAWVSPSAHIGCGVTVLPKVIVHTHASVGDFACINSGAIVEHDCSIGDHTFVQPGAVLAGGVTIGAGSVVGIGASIRERTRIGDNCIIGAGAYVHRDIPDNSVAYGVPVKIVRENMPLN